MCNPLRPTVHLNLLLRMTVSSIGTKHLQRFLIFFTVLAKYYSQVSAFSRSIPHLHNCFLIPFSSCGTANDLGCDHFVGKTGEYVKMHVIPDRGQLPQLLICFWFL